MGHIFDTACAVSAGIESSELSYDSSEFLSKSSQLALHTPVKRSNQSFVELVA